MLKERTSMVPAFDGGHDTKPIMTRGRIYSIWCKFKRYCSFLGSSVTVQQYPDVVALLWTGIKFILNLSLNDLRTFDATTTTIEEIVDTMCFCENYDQIFFPRSTDKKILNKIPPVYSVCLEFIAKALKYVRKGNIARWIEDAVNSFEREFQPLIDKIRQLRENLAMEVQHPATTQTPTLVKEPIRTKILNWVSEIKSVDHYSHACRDRTMGTGRWLFEKPEFTCWIESNSSVLWLYGRAGSGKTVLSSTIIDSLRATFPHVPVLYFYCNYKEESRQQMESIVRTLYKDLVVFAGKKLDQKLISEYDRFRDNSSCINFNTTKRLFLAEASKYDMLFLVLDALDECNNLKNKVNLVKYLAEEFLDDCPSHSQVKIFFTSRHDSHIQKILARKLSYEIDANDTSKDLRPFIEERLDRMIISGELLLDISEDVRSEIIEALCDKAGGMFLWVDFQLKAICEQANLQGIRQQLRELPQDMNETYGRMFDAIDEKSARVREWAYRTLLWVFGAAEPLTPEQLVQATAVQIGKETIMAADFAFSAQSLVDLCCHMVVIDKNADRVRFVHFSVHEYLASQQRFKSVHQHLGRVCLTAMGIHDNMDKVKRGVIESFYNHAARNLQSYAEGINQRSYSEIAQLLMRLHVEELSFQTRTYEMKNMLDELQRRPCTNRGALYEGGVEEGLPIPVKYIMAYYNLSAALKHDLEITSVDTKTIAELLLIAVDQRYVSTIQVAKFKPCSVNFHFEGPVSTALYLAARSGFQDGVQILLGASAEVNAQGGSYGNALQAAASRGISEVVEMLLKAGAEVNAQGGRYGNALQAAATSGKSEVVEMLLKAGAEVNAQGGYYGNALQAAATSGKSEMVEMLLKAGAEVNAQGGYYANALQAAAVYDRSEMVEIFFKAGAEVNAQGGHYGNALQAAAVYGGSEMVEIFFKAGAEVNAQGGHYGNALQAAATIGKSEMVEMLLKAGAEVNAEGGEHGNALQAAAHMGHMETVEILLKAGADVTARGGKYETALKAAKAPAEYIWGGKVYKDVKGLVNMLVEAGAME